VYVIVRLTLQCFEKLLLKALYRIKFIIIIIFCGNKENGHAGNSTYTRKTRAFVVRGCKAPYHKVVNVWNSY